MAALTGIDTFASHRIGLWICMNDLHELVRLWPLKWDLAIHHYAVLFMLVAFEANWLPSNPDRIDPGLFAIKYPRPTCIMRMRRCPLVCDCWSYYAIHRLSLLILCSDGSVFGRLLFHGLPVRCRHLPRSAHVKYKLADD